MKIILSGTFIILLLLGGYLYFKSTSSESTLKKTPQSNNRVVEVKGIKIPVTVADEPQELTQGLSGKEKNELADNSGMLFVLPEAHIPSFWMIDMSFPIDMIWIRNGEIIGISKNVPAPEKGTPPSELPKYSPGQLTDHVLEVHSGFSERHDLRVGDKFTGF